MTSAIKINGKQLSENTWCGLDLARAQTIGEINHAINENIYGDLYRLRPGIGLSF